MGWKKKKQKKKQKKNHVKRDILGPSLSWSRKIHGVMTSRGRQRNLEMEVRDARREERWIRRTEIR